MGTRAEDKLCSNRPGLDREALLVLLVSLLFTLPIWIATYPPMADYPQHLSMASILRWYHDPARRLTDTYTFAYVRPNTVFVYLVCALSYLMPLGVAGKLLMAASVAATGPAGLALARRMGRPGWYGLFALLTTYNFAFFFGFVNNVIATPLLLYGLVMVDRLLDRPIGRRAWLQIALLGSAFYFVHVQFLFIFVCAVGWLTLTRYPGWRRSLYLFSALTFGVAMELGHYFLRNEETYTYHERRILTGTHEMPLIFEKLLEIPDLLFGQRSDNTHWLLFFLALLAVALLLQSRAPAGPKEDATDWTHERARQTLQRTRFASLSAWFFVGYLLMPHIFVGVFVYQRMIAVACMILPAILPPVPYRPRLAPLVLGLSIAVHLILTTQASHVFHLETKGAHELIAKTKPGSSLMALPLGLRSSLLQDPPLLLHVGAAHVAEKGGRMNFHFSELHISMVQLRPGLSFDDQLATVNEWSPESFRFGAFGYHYDYFLFRGDFAMLKTIFADNLKKMAWEISDDWMLLWRKQSPFAAR